MAAIQTDPQYKLRLPSDLKVRIEAAAQRNNRSMNAEIVSRLEQTFDAETKPESSQDAPENHLASVKSPYYADHYLLLLGPSVADYLLEKNEYVRFVRSYADNLLQMDYKYPEERLEAQLLAADYMISRGSAFPPDIEKELAAAVARLSRAHRTADAASDKPASDADRSRSIMEELARIVREGADDPFNLKLPARGAPTTPSTPTPKRPSRAR